jgi:hypothetical protein
MPDQYVTMLTALTSAVAGGAVALLGVFLTNRSSTARLKVQLEHELRQRTTDLLRGRGEELYELTDKWLITFAKNYLSLSAVMQNKITYNQHYDLTIEEGKKSFQEYGRIEMLIDVYFPSTRPAYDKIIEARDELNNVINAHKRSYKNGDIDGYKFLKPFIQSQKSIEQAGVVFKMQILESIRHITY